MVSWGDFLEAEKLIQSGLPESIARGISMLQHERNSDSRHCKFLLGRVYESGLGVVADANLARDYYSQAMDSEDLDEQDHLAWMFEMASHEPAIASLAIVWLEKNFALGSTEATFALGYRYADGVGVAKNPELAEYYLKLAVKNDSSSAAERLAKLYEELGNRDAERLEALEFAASHGSHESQYLLAAAYRDGLGTQPDHGKYMSFLTKAACEEGLSTALIEMASIELDAGSPFFSPSSGVNRLSILLERAKKNMLNNEILTAASWKLGLCFLRGVGIGKSSECAGIAFLLSATLGHEEATDEFWRLHESGDLSDEVEGLSASGFDENLAFLIEHLSQARARNGKTQE